MENEIKPGTFLIYKNAPLPGSLRINRADCSNGWCTVTGMRGNALDREIREAGWTFFFLAGEVRASALGVDPEKAMHKALQRVLADQESEKFNCLEITLVARKRFLGLYFVSVSAHWRHIQESMFLSRRERLVAWEQVNLTLALKPSFLSPHP
jgi:hypothetical protein